MPLTLIYRGCTMNLWHKRSSNLQTASKMLAVKSCVCVCVSMHVCVFKCACVMVCLKVKGDRLEVGSLFSPCGFQRLTLGLVASSLTHWVISPFPRSTVLKPWNTGSKSSFLILPCNLDQLFSIFLYADSLKKQLVWMLIWLLVWLMIVSLRMEKYNLLPAINHSLGYWYPS